VVADYGGRPGVANLGADLHVGWRIGVRGSTVEWRMAHLGADLHVGWRIYCRVADIEWRT